MKKIFLIMTMALTATGAMAQKNIEKEMKALINDKSITRVRTENYDNNKVQDYPTTFCHFTSLQLKKNQAKELQKLEEAFEKDINDGYQYVYMTPEIKADQIKVVYGPHLEYSVTFCAHKTHNYRVLMVNDKNQKKKRYVYAMVWYDEGDGIRCMLYTIYGDKPSKGTITTTTTTTTTFNSLDELKHIKNDLKGLDDIKTSDFGSIGNMTTIFDGKDVTVITDNNGKTRITNYKNPTNDVEFIAQFGNLRAAFLDAVKDADKRNLQTGIAVKLLDLCKNHGKLIQHNNEEVNACTMALVDMRNISKNNLKDNFICGILESARKYLQ